MICRGCNQEIKTKKERYTHVEDFNCENKEGESWWHIACFKKAMNRTLTELEKTAKMMLDKASTLYKHLPEEFQQKEEFIIT